MRISDVVTSILQTPRIKEVYFSSFIPVDLVLAKATKLGLMGDISVCLGGYKGGTEVSYRMTDVSKVANLLLSMPEILDQQESILLVYESSVEISYSGFGICNSRVITGHHGSLLYMVDTEVAGQQYKEGDTLLLGRRVFATVMVAQSKDGYTILPTGRAFYMEPIIDPPPF